MLLSLVCKKKREEVTNKLVEFIYQLSVKDIKVVRTLKELNCFVKKDKKKQLTLLVMIIKLDNNS